MQPNLQLMVTKIILGLVFTHLDFLRHNLQFLPDLTAISYVVKGFKALVAQMLKLELSGIEEVQ